MMSSRTRNGRQKVADRGNKALSHDAVKLLKTQDAGYLRTMAQKARKERERLEEDYLLGEGRGVRVLGQGAEAKEREHTIFVESREEQQDFRPEKWFGTTEEGLNKVYNRPRAVEIYHSQRSDDDGGADKGNSEAVKAKSKRAVEAELQARKDRKALRRLHKRAEEARRHRLEAAKVRERNLIAAERELDLQRARMSNSIGGVNRNGIKWKVKERKK